MKKSLLLAFGLGACALQMHADVATVYSYINPEYDVMYNGILNRVSANGRWAVGGDTEDKTGSLIIDTTNPDKFIHLSNGALFDVTNDGMCVGSLFDNQGTADAPVYYLYAAIYEDGEWYQLPVPPSQSGQSYARAVSSDGKYIAGMAFCKDLSADIQGKYYPVLWTYNESILDYDVHAFTDLELPENFGMDINDVSEDGTILAGSLRTYAGSLIPAIVKNGELKHWNTLEVKPWPWIWNGQIQYDKNGNPYMFDTGFVDGLNDGSDDAWFNGGFYTINGDYIYGHRSKVVELNPETGEGATDHYRMVYRISTDEFIDEPSQGALSCGIGTDKMFSFGVDAYYNYFATVVENDIEKKIQDYYTLDGDVTPAAIYGIDETGNIMACSTVWFNDAIGEFCESPCLVVVENGAGVDNIVADKPVTATDGAVYDIYGRRVLSSAAGITNLPAGIYIHSGKKIAVK